MAELADAPDLGSGALRRGGSSPFSRTNFIAPLEVYFFCLKLSINLDIYIDKHIQFDSKIGTDLTTTLYVIINELELFK